MPLPNFVSQIRTSPSNLSADLTTYLSRPVSAARRTARKGNDDVWAGAFHDVPSAVSEKISVGSGKINGHCIRTRRKVSDEVNVVLLMPDAHDTPHDSETPFPSIPAGQDTSIGRGRFPERRQSNIINALKRIRRPREASLIETREYRDKKWFSILLHNVVKPEDVDDPSDNAFRALPPMLTDIHAGGGYDLFAPFTAPHPHLADASS
ncbi:hypothetical protein EDB83DRAFT_2520695 [Lactarius deliciosus]|nr:hypothetical protein EDB83DRAFT_2520695 [Lactarius deliciosus]